MSNIFEDSIKALEKSKKAVVNEAIKSEDVKNGKVSAEVELQEPDYVLWNHIIDQCIKMLKLPETQKVFNNIKDKFGEDTAKSLLELFTMSTTQACHDAIDMYDELMWKSLNKQFKSIIDFINLDRSTLHAHEGILKVFRAKIDNIESSLKIQEFNKANNNQ